MIRVLRKLAPIAAILALCPPAGWLWAAKLDLCEPTANWRFAGGGGYSGESADVRGLLRIEHSWDLAVAGSFGAFSREVNVPVDWSGPVFLRFYCSDNYFGAGLTQASRPTPDAALSKFVGHRSKQVLVGQQVVWSRDIADDDGRTLFAVDLSQHVRPGETFTLTVRNYEHVDSAHLLADDIRLAGRYGADPTPPSPGWADNFASACYFGDIVLLDTEPTELPERAGMPALKVRAPERAVATEPERAELPLALRGASGLPQTPFPVTCGVPFHRGELRDARPIALVDSTGTEIGAQSTPLALWDDGSVKWALLDFLASAANSQEDTPYRLVHGSKVRPARRKPVLQVAEYDGRWVARTGQLQVVFGLPGGTDLISSVSYGSQRRVVLRDLRCFYTVRGALDIDTATARLEAVTLETAGSVRAQLLLSGSMVGQHGADYGRFELRVELWDRTGFMRLSPRIFMDLPESGFREITRYELSAQTPLARDALVTTAYGGPAPLGRELRIDQNHFDRFVVSAEGRGEVARGEVSEGWMDVAARGIGGSAGLAVFVRDFAQRYPARLAMGSGRLRAVLFSPGGRVPVLRASQGESYRHQLMMLFHDATLEPGELQAVWQSVQRPPALLDAARLRDTEALGRIGEDSAARELVPGLHQAIGASRWACALSDDCGTRGLGLRHFPDRTRALVPGDEADRLTYDNYAEESLRALGTAYAATGDPELLHELTRGAWHCMDTDLCRFSPQAPWRVGGVHAGGWVNHVGGEVSAAATAVNGLTDYYLLTGDADALEALGLMAGFCLNQVSRPAQAAADLRGAAYTLWSLARLYVEFRQERYDTAFRTLLTAVMDRCDLRRGSLEGAGVIAGYRGSDPATAAILQQGLVEYYRATEDPTVGAFAAALGACVFEEATRVDGLIAASPLNRPQDFGLAPQALPLLARTAWLLADPQIRAVAFRSAQAGVESGAFGQLRGSCGLAEALWYMNRQ